MKKFKVDDFTKDGIQHYAVDLEFYRDTLIDFSSAPNAGLKQLLTAKYPNYTQSETDKDEIIWHNGAIRVSYSDPSGKNELFTIYDEVKNSKIQDQEAIEKANYLKKVGANL